MGRTPHTANRQTKNRPTLKDTIQDPAETLLSHYLISQQLTTLNIGVGKRITKVKATLIKAAKTEWQSQCRKSSPA